MTGVQTCALPISFFLIFSLLLLSPPLFSLFLFPPLSSLLLSSPLSSSLLLSPLSSSLSLSLSLSLSPLPAAILIARLRVAEPRYVGTRARFRVSIAAAPEQRGPPGQTFYLGLTAGYAEREHGLQGPCRTKGSKPR